MQRTSHECSPRRRAEKAHGGDHVVLTSPDAGRQQLVADVASIALTTNEPETLRSIALGAFAAGLFRPDDSATMSGSKSVLRTVRQRLKELRVAVERDAYLTAIFEKMGV